MTSVAMVCVQFFSEDLGEKNSVPFFVTILDLIFVMLENSEQNSQG